MKIIAHNMFKCKVVEIQKGAMNGIVKKDLASSD